MRCVFDIVINIKCESIRCKSELIKAELEKGFYLQLGNLALFLFRSNIIIYIEDVLLWTQAYKLYLLI